jgi:pimeloyl-ACP methyl ester carboxylesterase
MTPCYARPEIVLLHGMWCTGATLEPIASQFRAAGYMVHTPTLPLHKSDLSPEERRKLGKVSMQQYATYLRSYIQNLQLNQPPVLVGHSMGGLLAQILATQIATRALLLVSPAPAAGNNLIHLKSLTAASFILFSGRFWKKSNRPSLWHSKFCLFNQVSPDQREKFHHQLVEESGLCFAEIVFWFLNKKKPTYIDLSKITCPVRVMAGAKDRLILPDVTRKASRDMPKSQLAMYANHGHMMYLEPGADRAIQDMVAWVENAISETMPAEIPHMMTIPESADRSAA